MKRLIILVLTLALFLAGCSNEEKTDNTPLGGVEKTTSTLNSLAVLKEISDLTAKGMSATYKVTYDVDYGDGQKTEVTTYFKGEKKIRVDSVSKDYSASMFLVDEKVFMCTKQQDKTTCLKASPEDQKNPADVKIDTETYEKELGNESEADTFKVYKDGTITVSGHIATCYKMESAEGYQTYCFSKEGVMLYTKIVDNETDSELIAKSYSTTVSDSDFEIPKDAEIIDLNQDLAGIQQEYGDQIQDMNDLGICYEACDTQYGDSPELESCYAAC